jgi:hypothetical protein
MFFLFIKKLYIPALLNEKLKKNKPRNLRRKIISKCESIKVIENLR